MNYFGIDVHSTYHKVVGLTADGESLEYDIPNNREGKEQLQEILLEHAPCAVTMEACTGAYKLYDLLEPVSQRITLLHPPEFRRLFKKSGRKNDRIDATHLCKAARLEVEGIWVPDEATRQRRALSTRRVSVTQRRTASKNSVKSAFREYHVQLPKYCWSDVGLKELRSRARKLPATIALGVSEEIDLIEHYDRVIAKLDQRMADLAWGDKQIELLMSVPGINYHSAFVIMAEIGDVGRFSSAKQLTSYAGLVPKVSQSGLSGPRLGSISKKGRSRLRWIMVECGHISARYAPKLQRLKWRVKKRSGQSNIAIVAVARKLLELCYYILKSGEPYSESIPEKHQAKLRNLGCQAKKGNAA